MRKEKTKEEKKAQRRMYYEAHREEILRKYREKKQKTTFQDRITVWNEQIEKRLEEEKDKTIRFWLESQEKFNKMMMDGKA